MMFADVWKDNEYCGRYRIEQSAEMIVSTVAAFPNHEILFSENPECGFFNFVIANGKIVSYLPTFTCSITKEDVEELIRNGSPAVFKDLDAPFKETVSGNLPEMLMPGGKMRSVIYMIESLKKQEKYTASFEYLVNYAFLKNDHSDPANPFTPKDVQVRQNGCCFAITAVINGVRFRTKMNVDSHTLNNYGSPYLFEFAERALEDYTKTVLWNTLQEN